jgi:hypothetical protein
MDREQIRARQTTIEAHVYSTSGKQGLWDALEHNAWMRNDISALLTAIDDLEVRNAKLEAVAVFMKKRGRKVSDCEAVKTTYVDRRPRFRYCGRCPMCKVWAALDALDG